MLTSTDKRSVLNGSMQIMQAPWPRGSWRSAIPCQRHRPKDLEGTAHGLINGHNSACVVKFSTIVRGTEKRDKRTPCEELIPILDNLVRPADEVEAMLAQKALHNIWAECERNTSVILAPTTDLLLGIRP